MSIPTEDYFDSPNESSPLVTSTPPTIGSRGLRRVSANLPNISPIVEESQDSITIRRPVTYRSINDASLTDSDRDSPTLQRTVASLSRYKYYNKLSSHSDSTQSLLMPHHVVPPEYFLIIPIKPVSGKQNSLITIFSIWNTMMGTSLLSMPWALSMAGFGFGLALMIIIAGLALYTAYRVMQSTSTIPTLDNDTMPEFSDVCRHYLGKWGAYTSLIFSFIALLGAAIVYWVLMTNFLYNTVSYIYAEANHEMNTTAAIVIGNVSYEDAYCPHHILVPTTPPPSTTSLGGLLLVEVGNHTTPSPSSRDSLFKQVWHQQHTVPLFLVLIILPLANFKSPTFFTKFNALGTFSVLYILTFVSVKAAKWGFHVDFHDTNSVWYIEQFRWSFPALSGTLSLAYFIHNCVISIVQNQKNPENNGRDLSIAYVCVLFTYVFVGAIFYTSFPLAKSCIQDNLLNNFRGSDMMAFVARICLFIQMLTVFPLLLYIIRAQFMHAMFYNVYPSFKHVLVLNIVILTVCVLFAVFLPHIGAIIRYSGALCGLVYIFALPCLVYIMNRRQEGTLTKPIIAFHLFLILLGLLNFIGQFVITS